MQMQNNPSHSSKLAGCQIAVIGAGIGGVAAALALAQRGASVQVFEQATALTEVGAGLQISSNGVSVLHAMGLKDMAATLASAPDAAELRNAQGGLVARLPLGDAATARYGQPYWQFHRADLLDLLVNGAKTAGVWFALGARAEAWPDGRLMVDGQSHHFDVIIAADGVRSAHRSQYFDGVEPRFLNFVAWRALIPAAGLPADLRAPAARVFMGPGRHLVSYPLRGGTLMNLVGVVEWADWVGESWSEQADGDAFRAAFSRFGGAVPALLKRVDACYRWGLFGHAPVANWAQGKLALLGDACHPTLPFLAQGATQALEDAWCLAAELDSASDIETGLKTYQSARKPRADAVVRAAASNGRLYHLETPALRMAAHLGLRTASRAMPGLLQRKFDWIYSKSVDAKR